MRTSLTGRLIYARFCGSKKKPVTQVLSSRAPDRDRATMFVRRCEILDFRHALEHAWEFAQLRYGEGSAQADGWVHALAQDLRAGKVQQVIARWKRLRPKTPELQQSLQALIHYYSENAGRMHYDEYLQLGYAIGSGAVESAHKQVVHARFRQAGMRWSEAGACWRSACCC